MKFFAIIVCVLIVSSLAIAMEVEEYGRCQGLRDRCRNNQPGRECCRGLVCRNQYCQRRNGGIGGGNRCQGRGDRCELTGRLRCCQGLRCSGRGNNRRCQRN